MRWWQYYLDHSKVDMSLDLDREAQRIAEETGIPVEVIKEEADRIASGNK